MTGLSFLVLFLSTRRRRIAVQFNSIQLLIETTIPPVGKKNHMFDLQIDLIFA